MAKRDYYTVLGVARDGIRRGHQEGVSQARDEAPSGPQLRRQDAEESSRKRRKPTRSSPTPASAPPTTSSAMPASIRRRASARGARGAEGFGGFADAFGDIFGEIFGQQRGGGARQRRLPRRRPALQPRAVARGCGARHRGQDPHPDDGGMRDLPWQRRQAGHAAADCPTCHGRGEVRVSQGFFSIQQTLPAMPRHRQDRSATRARRAAARAGCASTRRCRSRFPRASTRTIASGSPAKARPAMNGGPPGDLYVVVDAEAAPGVPARRRRPALRNADQLRHGGARRRDRDSDARRPREDQDSAGNADRPGVPAAQQGHPARCAVR